MKNISIEKIHHSEINEVASLLTEAFITNPAYSIIFKNKNQLEKGLWRVFKASLILNNEKQPLTNVIKEKETGKIIGTFTLIPPQGVKNSISIYLKIGLPSFVFKFGINSLLRMLSLDSINKKVLIDSMKVSEFHYLSMVVIKEEYRGRGIGSFAIKSAIQVVISSNPTCKLIGLTTQLPENVTFYSRLGFQKLDEGYIHFKGDTYYNYNMRLILP